MKTTDRNHIIRPALLAGLLLSLSLTNTFGQFNSGSTGTNGALNITTNTTLDLPSHGQFHCTTITVASNATLKFTPNDLNTPVYLLATGNVTINGTIDVSGAQGAVSLDGAGGPGGFAGGNAAYLGLQPSDGHGPGAGRAGTTESWGISTNLAGYASYGTSGNNGDGGNGAIYGSPLLIPLVGGSGGGGRPSKGGSGGGGAILIASSTSIAIGGAILSQGGGYANVYDGVGSGGAIRLVSPVVSGNGSLSVYSSAYMSGGYGRIRIDCMDRHSLALTYNPSSVGSIGANMVVFPANPPRLDITQVAGTNIPVGTNSAVFFTLPQGSSTNQNVIVQASNFSNSVSIRVVLTPDNGSSTSYDTQIDNTTVNPASVTVPVVLPVNVQVQVNAWTR